MSSLNFDHCRSHIVLSGFYLQIGTGEQHVC